MVAKTNNATNNVQLTTNGQLLIGSTSATPVVSTLTAGSNVTITNAAGAITIAASAGGSGALTWIASGTASSSATLDFANNLSSTYDNYLIVIEDVSPASNAVTTQVRIGTGSTPTYQTSSYSGNGICFAGAASYSSGTGAIDLTIATRTSSTAKRIGGGHIQISNVNNATDDKQILSTYQDWDSSGSNDNVNVMGGRWQSGTVLTSVRFLMSSGNISTGIYKLYGYQN